MRLPSQPFQADSIEYRAGGRCAKARRGIVAGILVSVASLWFSPPAAHADGVRYLNSNRDAFQARVDLIEQATTQISLAYYAVDTDEVPTALIELLRQASLRGVDVRILVDGLISQLPSNFERYLRDAGIRMRVYHRPHEGNPRWLNKRLHNKMLMVDCQHLIIGSRNLEDQHFGVVEDCDDSFVDCDAYLCGHIACQAQAYFDRIWSSQDVQSAPDRDSLGLDILNYRPIGRTPWSEEWRDARGPIEYQQLLDQSISRAACRLNAEFQTGRDWSSETVPIENVRLLHDCRTDKSCQHMQRQIIELMDSARCSLVIESPYPAFTDAIRDAILSALDRGVHVTMLTNSLKSTDQLGVYAAYQNNKRRLLRRGVELYEYKGPGTLHTKAMVVDNHVTMIGSYNFDARSDRHNLEIAVAICGRESAEALRHLISCRIKRSEQISRRLLLLETSGGENLFRRSRMMLKRGCVELYRGFL